MFEIARIWDLRVLNFAISFLGFPSVTNSDSVVASEGTMRPKKHETTDASDLFRARLDQIINMKHCMSSEHFGQLAWQFKRVSGSSGLKVQAAIAC